MSVIAIHLQLRGLRQRNLDTEGATFYSFAENHGEKALNSAEAQLRAQSELKASESLAWTGVPNPRDAAIGAIPETVTPGIVLVAFAVLWMVGAYSAAISTPATSHQSSPVLGQLVIASILLIAGLLHFARPLWVYRRALRTVYAITSHRLMIIRGNGSRGVDSLDPAEIVEVQCRAREGGSGNLMISTSFSVRTKNSFARRRWWFYGVSNVEEVAHLVSELKQHRSQALSRADRFIALDFNSPA